MRRRSMVTIYVSIAACFGLVAAACGSSGSNSGGASPSNAESASGLVSPTAGGGQLEWNSIEGQDTVLWFWAPW